MTKRASALLCVAWCFAIGGVCTNASAQTTADATTSAGEPPRLDTVYLNDGSFLRGTLLEVIRDDHVTILLHDGSTTRVPWSSVARVEPAPPPSIVQPATPVTPVTIVPTTPRPLPTAAEPITGPTVLVHIVAPGGTTLDRKPKDAETWGFACEAPCDVQLPLNNEYRVAGPGFHASSTFELEASPGQRVTLTVNPGSKTAKAVGLVVGGIGVNTVIVGLLVLAVGALSTGQKLCGPVDPRTGTQTHYCDDPNTPLTNAGWITIGAGLALWAGGGLLAWLNWRTTVSQTP